MSDIEREKQLREKLKQKDAGFQEQLRDEMAREE